MKCKNIFVENRKSKIQDTEPINSKLYKHWLAITGSIKKMRTVNCNKYSYEISY